MTRKRFQLIQWAVLLGGVALAAYFYVRPHPQPVYNPETWKSWDGFMALSYAGVGDGADPRYPSKKELASQMKALADAGYQCVRAEDIEAFLAGQAPLPSKALLILFEGGRKDSLIRATPLLARNGLMAVMSVPTAPVQKWGTFHLKASELRKATRLPQWRFASMGNEADQEIQTSADGKTGHFLTGRLWMDGRAESPKEYRERVARDYAESADVLEKAVGYPVSLYVYPFADAGFGSDADPSAYEVNRAALSNRYRLAFTGANDPFNGADSDPLSLTRLRIAGGLDGPALLKELDQYQPRQAVLQNQFTDDAWLLIRDARLAGGQLAMDPSAITWLRGTEQWSDVETACTIELDPGATAFVYARYSGPRAYVRAALSAEGLRIQERVKDRMQTLSWTPLAPSESILRAIRMRVRGNRVWVWSEERLVAGPLPLTSMTQRGRIGFGADRGRAVLRNYSCRPIPHLYAFAQTYSSVPETEKDSIGAILAEWTDSQGRVAVSDAMKSDLMSASAAGVQVVPILRLQPGGDEARIQGLCDSLDAALQDPTLRTLVKSVAIEGPNAILADRLHQKGLRVIHILKAADALRAIPAFTSETDEALIRFDGTDLQPVVETILHMFPAARLMVEASGMKNPPAGVHTVLDLTGKESEAP